MVVSETQGSVARPIQSRAVREITLHDTRSGEIQQLRTREPGRVRPLLPRRGTVRRMRRLVVGVVVFGLGLSASAVEAKVLPTFPTCGAFSASKVSRVVGVGKLYLDNTLANHTSCTYYGVSAARATKLATMGVAYTKIAYYPSVIIAVTPATKSLVGVQISLIKQTVTKEDLEFGAVNKRLRFTRDEDFYSGAISGGSEMKCDPQIQYDNWVGPPDCDGEPALRKVGVVAFIPTAGSLGRLLTITATQQVPGKPFALAHPGTRTTVRHGPALLTAAGTACPLSRGFGSTIGRPG